MKTASTPIETYKALLKDEEVKDVDVYLCRLMIGSLMYMTTSRPDIMFVVCACARFQVTHKVSHLYAMKRIFRYLKGQPKLGLWYHRDSPFDLEAFSDSNYARASLDRKSTIGGCQFLGKRLISWQCRKQTIVANSTTEVEYVAATNCYRQSRMDGRTCNIEQKCVKSQIPKRGRDTKIPQSGGPPAKVGDEAVHKELGDRMKRVGEGSTVPVESHHTPTSAPFTSQPPTLPPSMQTTHVAEEAATMPYDSPLLRVHSHGSDEGSMTLHELAVLCTTLSKKVESLESGLRQTKLTYGAAYTKLIMKVKKLENRIKSSKARRRVRLIVLKDKGDLEDPSKQGRKIAQLDDVWGLLCVTRWNIGELNTLQQLKKLFFDEIKELFETTMKRVKDFVLMKSNRLVPKISTGSSKRIAETELDHEGSKRQKSNVKYPIIDWEVYSEDTKKYWKIIRVGKHTDAYLNFDDMLKKFVRDDR
ncbi:hypothetical protein Tco_0749685 [Tanacetum coccineum]|uniref:Uncharacterized protein n=1 Tax=Tanacetum coccineum TaxID=301880 RepID=A0ABQ4YZ78_9ASTR